MTRIALHLDSLLGPGSSTATAAYARAATVASLAGADAIVATVPTIDPDKALPALRQAADCFDGFFILACPLRDDTVHTALELRPDLVVLTSRNGGFLPLEDSDLAGPTARDMARALQGSQLDAGFFVTPGVPVVKATRQLAMDTIVLDARELASARDMGAEIEALEALQSATLAAEKLELRTLIAGDLSRRDRDVIVGLDRVDGVILGDEIARRALLLGLPAAVGEWRV